MAAPTPISALVHSSTLVAAGLYLIMRFYYLVYSSNFLMFTLLVLSVFTSFYAGLNALVETDMKKLIALSTLSHLGFIGLAFSSGLISLAFLHMLVHALFKSLLFMCMGDIMHCSHHSQDVRHLGSGFASAPFSCQVMHLCLANLLGLPMLRGFFSKDLVLEFLSYSNMR
jgi:NADH-ubiquinone oxidoreductase chain 5